MKILRLRESLNIIGSLVLGLSLGVSMAWAQDSSEPKPSFSERTPTEPEQPEPKPSLSEQVPTKCEQEECQPPFAERESSEYKPSFSKREPLRYVVVQALREYSQRKNRAKANAHWYQKLPSPTLTTIHSPYNMSYCEAHTFGAKLKDTLTLQINCGANNRAWQAARIAAQRWNQLRPEKAFFKISNTCSQQHKPGDRISSLSFIPPEKFKTNWMRSLFSLATLKFSAFTIWDVSTLGWAGILFQDHPWAYPNFRYKHNCKNYVRYNSHTLHGCVDNELSIGYNKNNKAVRTQDYNWNYADSRLHPKLGIPRNIKSNERAKKNSSSSRWIVFPKIQPNHRTEADIAASNSFFDHPKRAEFLQIFLLMHEMGHVLGLRHQPHQSQSLMTNTNWVDIVLPHITSTLLDTIDEDNFTQYETDNFTEPDADKFNPADENRNQAVTPQLNTATAEQGPPHVRDDFEVFPPQLNFLKSLDVLMHRPELIHLLAHDEDFVQELSDLIQPQEADKKAMQCLYDIDV